MELISKPPHYSGFDKAYSRRYPDRERLASLAVVLFRIVSIPVYTKFTETMLLNRSTNGYSVFSVLFIGLGELCAPSASLQNFHYRYKLFSLF